MWDIINKIEGMKRCSTLKSLRSYYERCLCFYGFDRYALAFDGKDKKENEDPIVLSNYEKSWVDYYFEQGYNEIDPVFLKTKNQTRPFLWSDVWHETSLNKKQTQLFNEAKDYEIAFGLCIPLQVRGRPNGLVSMVSSACKPAEIEQITKEHLPEIALLSTYFQQLSEALAVSDEQLIPGVKPALTVREKEVLNWLARGKTNAEIALITGMTEHTVRHHLKSLYIKLDVTSRVQAALAGYLAGWINDYK